MAGGDEAEGQVATALVVNFFSSSPALVGSSEPIVASQATHLHHCACMAQQSLMRAEKADKRTLIHKVIVCSLRVGWPTRLKQDGYVYIFIY